MFAVLRGMPEPYVRSAPYAWGLVKQGLYNLRNVGPWFTLRTFKKYVTRKSSREGGK